MSETLKFGNLEISDYIKKSIEEMGISELTQVQRLAINPALLGYDILAQAPTGTGKTFAFGIPLIESVDKESSSVQGIVVCPTRELALQVADEISGLLKYEENIRVLCVYGGENIERQITFLRKKPQIVVATPGRLNDHIKRKTINLSEVRTIVLDEADEMLSMGFLPDIDMILGKTPFDAQKLLFSATMPKEILNMAKKYQKSDAFKIKVQSSKKEVSPQISQYYLEMKHALKTDVLRALIDVNKYKLCLVFCNTKKKADELYSELLSYGYSVAVLHGDMKQVERDRVMYKFRNLKINILIATDVAARGVDVDGIEAVFNYDIPLCEEHYVHRIGRTGRADKTGIAYTFLSNSEMFRLREIMKYTKTNILPMKRPSIAEIELIKSEAIFEKAKEIADGEDIEEYINAIRKKADEGFDIQKLCASLLYMHLKPKKIKIEATETKKTPKKEEKNDGVVRLFFNVGSLDKIRNRHLEELINDHPMLSGMRIKGIDIYDKFSFMDVMKKDAKDICEALCGMRFKGRELFVEIAQESKKVKTVRKINKKRGKA